MAVSKIVLEYASPNVKLHYYWDANAPGRFQNIVANYIGFTGRLVQRVQTKVTPPRSGFFSYSIPYLYNSSSQGRVWLTNITVDFFQQTGGATLVLREPDNVEGLIIARNGQSWELSWDTPDDYMEYASDYPFIGYDLEYQQTGTGVPVQTSVINALKYTGGAVDAGGTFRARIRPSNGASGYRRPVRNFPSTSYIQSPALTGKGSWTDWLTVTIPPAPLKPCLLYTSPSPRDS